MCSSFMFTYRLRLYMEMKCRRAWISSALFFFFLILGCSPSETEQDYDFLRCFYANGGELLPPVWSLLLKNSRISSSSRCLLNLQVTVGGPANNRDLKQGRRRRLRERCLKILFPVTVIILRLLHVVRLGKCECAIQE